MKYYFLINPNSGKIDTNQFEQRILKECSKEKIKYKIFYTHNAGDAKKFAKKIPDEECVVFSVSTSSPIIIAHSCKSYRIS